MELPFFYIDHFDESKHEILLDEDTSKHVVLVLRKKTGEQLHLTDGKGTLLLCSIINAHKKSCLVKVESKTFKQPSLPRVTIAISLLKNTNRFEWFLEKATEIGVVEIIPLICERTEKEKFRQERLNGICISAMLQSQQVWLPQLQQPSDFKKVVEQSATQQGFIAHCDESGDKIKLSSLLHFNESTILLGPEGDFSEKEIQLALAHRFIPVSLGETRLRTETAGIVAATILLV